MPEAMRPGINLPGIYDISNAIYHAQCCDGPSMSSTGLRMLRRKTPAHFWAQSSINPEATPQPWSPALSFGSAAHSLLLENELPQGIYAVSPFGDFRKKDAREWRDENISAGKIIVTEADLKAIEGMAKSLARHPMIKAGLFRGEIERSLFWKRDGIDVWLKARPDVVPHDTIAADLKTVARGEARHLISAAADYGYHIQAAMIVDGLKSTLDRTIEQYAIVAVEKEPPYVVCVYVLSDQFLDIGRYEYIKSLELFDQCYRANDWPGYTDQELHPPEWLISKIELEEKYS